jgi:hypothetical protein
MSEVGPHMDRSQALSKCLEIQDLAAELEVCGFADLEARASEVRAIAHYMADDGDDVAVD